jgi:3-oxoacyl-[acyl-carrier protein] reductase
MEEIQGRIALVTGGSRGIGRAICLALAAAGADVAVNYHRQEAAAEAVCAQIRKTGRRALKIAADVTAEEDVGRLVASVEETLGPIAILVNNAGIAEAVRLEELTVAIWEKTIAANLTSVFRVTQAVVTGMRRQRWGRIISISSTAAQTGGIIGPHYAASKAGIHGLTHAYASLLVRDGITANVIAPALIETDMIRGHTRATPDRIPVGRFGRPEEVAGAVLMLARNAYVTGQTIHVNGGAYMS